MMTTVMIIDEIGFLVFPFLLSTASALAIGVKHEDERSSSAELDFLCGYGVHIDDYMIFL